MKISEVIDAVTTILSASPAFAGVTVIEADSATYNNDFEDALDSPGACVVVTYGGATISNPDKPVLRLTHEVLLAVAINTSRNSTGNSALGLAESAMELFQNREYGDRTKAVWKLSNPAVEIGPLEVGLNSYIVGLTIEGLQPINPSV